MATTVYQVAYVVGRAQPCRWTQPFWKQEDAARHRDALGATLSAIIPVPLDELDGDEREALYELDAGVEAPEMPEEISAAREESILRRQSLVPAQYQGTGTLYLMECERCGRKYETASADKVRCHRCRKLGER